VLLLAENLLFHHLSNQKEEVLVDLQVLRIRKQQEGKNGKARKTSLCLWPNGEAQTWNWKTCLSLSLPEAEVDLGRLARLFNSSRRNLLLPKTFNFKMKVS
jgi:hypothetical protein